jgi:membrane protein implicated in regulation of membrane protease activity
MAAGIAGAALLAAVLTFAVSFVGASGFDFESLMMRRASFVAVGVSIISALAIHLWNRYLRAILLRGNHIEAQIVSVRIGRHVSVAVRTESGRDRRVAVVGQFPFKPGQYVTLRSPQRRDWPLLVAELYGAV